MRKLLFAPLALALLASSPAQAGHGKHKECKHPVEECLNTMVTKLKTTGFIGVEYDHQDGRLIITEVVAGTPAQKAGLVKGDELVDLNGIPFNEKNYAKMGKIKKPGKQVTCTIRRNGATKKLKMTLGSMPADVMAKHIGEHMMSHAKKDAHAAAAP